MKRERERERRTTTRSEKYKTKVKAFNMAHERSEPLDSVKRDFSDLTTYLGKFKKKRRAAVRKSGMRAFIEKS